MFLLGKYGGKYGEIRGIRKYEANEANSLDILKVRNIILRGKDGTRRSVFRITLSNINFVFPGLYHFKYNDG